MDIDHITRCTTRIKELQAGINWLRECSVSAFAHPMPSKDIRISPSFGSAVNGCHEACKLLEMEARKLAPSLAQTTIKNAEKEISDLRAEICAEAQKPD